MARNKPIREYREAGKQYAYLLDQCIFFADYKGDFSDDKARIYLVLGNYKSWLNSNPKPKSWSIARHIGDWLRGLPSCCKVSFWNNEQVAIGQSWGFSLRSEAAQERFAENWWTICGQRLLEIADKLNVSYYRIRPYDYERTVQEQMAAAGV